MPCTQASLQQKRQRICIRIVTESCGEGQQEASNPHPDKHPDPEGLGRTVVLQHLVLVSLFRPDRTTAHVVVTTLHASLSACQVSGGGVFLIEHTHLGFTQGPDAPHRGHGHGLWSHQNNGRVRLRQCKTHTKLTAHHTGARTQHTTCGCPATLLLYEDREKSAISAIWAAA